VVNHVAPGDVAEHSPLQGITIGGDALPGGQKPFHQGKTLVHMAGHYFGLLHTFAGHCDSRNDGVEDTPRAKFPHIGGCSKKARETIDTCPDFEGTDPIDNFMDLGDDECLETFTPQQFRRAKAILALDRPSLVEASSIAKADALMRGYNYDARKLENIKDEKY